MQNDKQNLYNNLIRQIDRYKHYCHEGSYKTRERYYNACKRFCAFLAEEFHTQKFVNIGAKQFYAYAEYLKSRKSAATVQTELSAIRKVYEWLGGKNKFPDNRKLSLAVRRVGTVNHAWTPEEYRNGLALGISSERDDAYYAIRIAYLFGARKNEVCTMRVYQIKEAVRNDELIIKGKGGQIRAVPVRNDEQKAALAELTAYIRRNDLKPGDYLISDQFKGGVQRENKRLDNWLNYYRNQIASRDRLQAEDGMKPRSATITWHGLRHAYAQNLYAELRRSGDSEKSAKRKTSEALGHHRVGITNIYLAELPAGKKKT